MSDNTPKVNVEELLADRDHLRRILWDNGFRRCDVPACNCDSWHPHGGFYARFREIDEVVGDHNGKTLLRAVEEMRDENADLRAYKERTEAGLQALRDFMCERWGKAADEPKWEFIDRLDAMGCDLGLWRDPQEEVKP